MDSYIDHLAGQLVDKDSAREHLTRIGGLIPEENRNAVAQLEVVTKVCASYGPGCQEQALIVFTRTYAAASKARKTLLQLRKGARHPLRGFDELVESDARGRGELPSFGRLERLLEEFICFDSGQSNPSNYWGRYRSVLARDRVRRVF